MIRQALCLLDTMTIDVLDEELVSWWITSFLLQREENLNPVLAASKADGRQNLGSKGLDLPAMKSMGKPLGSKSSRYSEPLL